ncbi:MAG: fatty acid desaturase [Alphaproteobacteria bacterium]|nr:fatty acid desaturase [Alphaproteobacteria bacterium]
MSRTHPIPGGLNLALTAGVFAASLGLLGLGERLGGLGLAACALAFAVLGQTNFALIHEAEHDKLHPRQGVNDAAGVLLSALFPGSFTVLKAAHLMHHRRNRSDAELIDFYRPGERWAKTLKYYTLISGAIWVGSPLVSVALCFVPGRWFRPDPGRAKGTDLTTFLSFLEGVNPWRIRAEVALTVGLWAAVIPMLSLSWTTLALVYATFAFFWASQQYVYHVRTPLHLVEGSFDLRMPRWLGWLWLHFNYHLTHHRTVSVPWLYLPEVAQEQPWRPYLRTWLTSWRPPRPVLAAWPERFVARGPLPAPAPPEFSGPPSPG